MYFNIYIPFICKAEASHVIFSLKTVKPELGSFIDDLFVDFLLPHLTHAMLQNIISY